MKYLKMWNLTEEIIRALIKLKNEGYTIALDDFIYHKDLIGLLKIADIVKIDFLQTKETERKKVLNDILKINPHVRFLAEKVETREEFDQAKKDGYVYFQGYFFAKTAVVSNRDVPASKTLHLNLLKKITREDFSFDDAQEVLKSDVSLTYKFLYKFGLFFIKSEVKSIQHACVLLELDKIKKWIIVTLLGPFSQELPKELITTSIMRGKFCEIVGEKMNSRRPSDYFFITGLFSTIDVILGRSKEEILSEIYVFPEVKEAPLREGNVLNDILNLIISWGKYAGRRNGTLLGKIKAK
ncbi:HDOD domain-containing protein [Peptococcaceae bacterium]|nr:HDOD domain-containing protein [Peptococcaceae bacterium]